MAIPCLPSLSDALFRAAKEDNAELVHVVMKSGKAKVNCQNWVG